MIKKIILSFIFILAISAGLGVGYGAIRIFGFTYTTVFAYVSELKTNLTIERSNAQGGPEVENIIESEFNQTITQYTKTFEIQENKKSPRVSALSYLVADLETGKIFISQNLNQRLPIASVTKLMTAIVADETLGLDTETTVTGTAINTYGTQGEFRKGERYSVNEIFYPLLMESSNDAAEALALTKDRPTFIFDMNRKAQSIGLFNTTYEDASGLSPQNISTATDLFKLTQYISKYRKYIFDITTEKKKELGKKVWFSNSRFRSDSDYVGGKNGYTDEALKTQVALFDEDFGEEKRTVVYVVLRSTDVAYDIKMLRDYVHNNVEYK